MKNYIRLCILLCLVFYTEKTWSCVRSGTAGQYCGNAINHDCPPGCYCPGNGKKGTYTAYTKAKVKSWCKDRTGLNHGGLNDEGTILANCVYLCPDDFPDSDKKAKSVEECYKQVGDEKVYYGSKIKCDIGYYLPKTQTQCTKCSSSNTNGSQYCPGGEFPFSDKEDQGFSTCSSDKKPSSDKKSCVSNSITCSAGTYLPANATSCSVCKSRYYCIGGTFTISSADKGIKECKPGYTSGVGASSCVKDDAITAENQTIKECPKGQLPNADGTACVEEKAPKKQLDCDSGYYVRSGQEKCEKCKGSKKYCPGGAYYVPSTSDQGIYECPHKGVVNDIGDACKITLSKEDLMYGPGRKNGDKTSQCWNYIGDSDEYMECIFGEKLRKNN